MSSGSGTITPVAGGGGSSSVGLGWAQPIPRTLLPITRYAEIMRIPLPHFWQLNGAKAPETLGCSNAIWDENDRNSLGWTILQAEEMIADFLHFQPAPKFQVDEEIAFSLPGVRGDWENAEVEVEWAKVECFGTETLTAKLEDASVTYQDLDSDPLGREETATIEVSNVTACDNACDVAVFFRTEDGAEDTAHPDWEIRPIKVDIDGTTMTIRAETSLFVQPSLRALTKADCLGSSDTDEWKVDYDTSNFVSLVDVYCRTVSQQSPITLKWDGVCDCTGVCQHKTQTACAYVTDKRRGFFAPRASTWNGTTNIYAVPTYCFPPESILASYRSGLALDARNCRMNANMERAIVKLTNALLPNPPCGFCSEYSQRMWDNDRKAIDPLTPEAASMPWDIYKQGALEAWRIIKLFSMGVGGKIGRGYR